MHDIKDYINQNKYITLALLYKEWRYMHILFLEYIIRPSVCSVFAQTHIDCN